MGDRDEPREMRFLLVAGAALTSYLGLGIAIWQIDADILLLLVYVLVVMLAFIVVRQRRLVGDLAALRRDYREALALSEEVKTLDALSRGMLGLVGYLLALPRGDTRHHLISVEEEFVISGDDGLYSWSLHGFNAVESISSQLFVKVSGDSPMDVSEIPIQVVDLREDRPLVVQCISDRPNCKTYAIEFLEPLARAEEFRIRIDCRWDNTFLRTRSLDYVYSAWGAFAGQGIDRLHGRLISDVELSDVLLERLEDGQRLREPRQPLVTSQHGGKWKVDWEVQAPESIYLLSFRKQARHR